MKHADINGSRVNLKEVVAISCVKVGYAADSGVAIYFHANLTLKSGFVWEFVLGGCPEGSSLADNRRGYGDEYDALAKAYKEKMESRYEEAKLVWNDLIDLWNKID